MKQNLDDYNLALGAQNGDMVALGALVCRLRSRLFGIAYAELRNYDDAQDVTANAFVRICTSIGDLRHPDRLVSWADGIVRNEVRRHAANRGYNRLLGDERGDSTDTESQILLRLDVRRALHRLPVAQAQAMTLFYLSGNAVAEIASTTGQPVGTVKSWLHHGRKRLRGLLEEYAPMTTASFVEADAAIKRALIVQSELSEPMIEAVKSALRRRGYEAYEPAVEESGRSLAAYTAANNDLLTHELGQFDAVVFDEMVHGVPAVAHVVNLRTDPDLRDVNVYVLVDDRLDHGGLIMAVAYFNAGVTGLIFKNSQASDNLMFPEDRVMIRWDRVTERAGQVYRQSMKEAHRFGASFIEPEHLLLGIALVPECLGARLLVEYNGVDLVEMRAAITRTLPAVTRRGDGYRLDDVELGHAVVGTIQLAQNEADRMAHTWLGAEHFLLGLLLQSDTTASKYLTEAGLTPERLREQVCTILESLRHAVSSNV